MPRAASKEAWNASRQISVSKRSLLNQTVLSLSWTSIKLRTSSVRWQQRGSALPLYRLKPGLPCCCSCTAQGCVPAFLFWRLLFATSDKVGKRSCQSFAMQCVDPWRNNQQAYQQGCQSQTAFLLCWGQQFPGYACSAQKLQSSTAGCRVTGSLQGCRNSGFSGPLTTESSSSRYCSRTSMTSSRRNGDFASTELYARAAQRRQLKEHVQAVSVLLQGWAPLHRQDGCRGAPSARPFLPELS